MDLAAWWQYYHDIGFSTIPLRAKDKKPFMAWLKYQETRATPEEINLWTKKYKNNNVAILTGMISGIIVLDIDGEEGWQYLKEHGYSLPVTPRAQSSPGKAHIYFQHPGGSVRTKVNTTLKIDVKGDGGYVVAPPSIHPSGSQYIWIEGFSPKDVPLAPAPQWLLDFIKTNAASPALSSPVEIGGSIPTLTSGAREAVLESKPGVSGITLETAPKNAGPDLEETDWEANCLGGVGDGERNVTCVKLAGKWIGMNIAPKAVYQMLLNWNQMNRPPMPDAEVKQVLESVLRRETRKKLKDKDLPPSLPNRKNDPDDIRNEQERNEDLLSGISTRYGITFKEIEEISGDSPKYIFRMNCEEKGDVEAWLTIGEIMNQQTFRTKIAGATKIIVPAIKSKNGEWDRFAQRIIQCAVCRQAGAGATVTGELLAGLEDYLKATKFVNIDTDEKVNIAENPFIYKAQPWFTLGAFRRWIANNRAAFKITHQETVQRLVVAGFEEARFRLPGIRKQQKFWRLPKNLEEKWEIEEKD